MSLRDLPPVDALAAHVVAPRSVAVAAARAVLAERRAELLAGAAGDADLPARARAWAAAAGRPSLRRVLNATGVIVHTNLGRAPLAVAAREAVAAVAEGYSNLEWDDGTRASRHMHVESLLCSLTGAEAGFAVNNGAGAALLAAAALAGPGRSVIVSRGQLVEIGGGFRVPDVIAQAGSRLVEVGTTNRTRLTDYADALGDDTGAVLRVHRSNFRQLGFVEDVSVESLCELGVPVIDDVGSGALDEVPLDAPARAARPHGAAASLADEPPVRRSVAAGAAASLADEPPVRRSVAAGAAASLADEPPVRRSVAAGAAASLADEPPVRRSVAAGAALVVFSGDKLLGGPQAGLLVGRAAAVDAARAHPLARALRIDKLSLAALEATLRLHRDAPEQIPVLAMLHAPEDLLRARAESLAALIPGAVVIDATARVGGGALPLVELPGPVVALPDASLAAALRVGDPPLVGRIEHDRLLLDPRTLSDAEVPLAAAAVRAAGSSPTGSAESR